MKKILAAAVVGGLMLGGTGVAFAATGGGSDPAPSATARSATPGAGRRAALAKGALKVVADTLHVDQKALVAELRSGKTIADVAKEHNVATQTVVDAIVNAGKARVATAVTNGKLTQAQADKIDQRLPKLATNLVNRHLRPERLALRRDLARGAVKVVADTLHVDQKALVAELRSGKTIADVAKEHNVATQTVVDAIVNAGKARVATAVTNGKLTQAQADKIDQRLPKLATNLVNRHFGAHAGAGAPGGGPANAQSTELAA